MRIEDLADQLYLHLEAEKPASPLTISSYRSDIRDLLRFPNESNVEPEVEAITAGVLRQCLIDLTAASPPLRACDGSMP